MLDVFELEWFRCWRMHATQVADLPSSVTTMSLNYQTSFSWTIWTFDISLNTDFFDCDSICMSFEMPKIPTRKKFCDFGVLWEQLVDYLCESECFLNAWWGLYFQNTHQASALTPDVVIHVQIIIQICKIDGHHWIWLDLKHVVNLLYFSLIWNRKGGSL